jgi:hypothetical protein
MEMEHWRSAAEMADAPVPDVAYQRYPQHTKMTSAIASSYCHVIVGSSISDAEHDIEAAELQLQIAR